MPTEVARLRDRRVPVDVQHADRPRPHPAHRRARAAQRDLRRRGHGAAGRAALLQREPHPPGRVAASAPRSSASTSRRVRQGAQAVRQAAAANQAIQFPLVELQTQCEMLRALIHKTAWQMDNVRARSRVSRQGVDVQLLGQPAVLRGGRPGDAGARRPRLLAGTSRSSTSTATTAATASPRAPRRSRCAASPATCSAS